MITLTMILRGYSNFDAVVSTLVLLISTLEINLTIKDNYHLLLVKLTALINNSTTYCPVKITWVIT